MFTSAEPNINHHIPLAFCLTPSFVLWLLCCCVSLLQQNCHQRSSRFQSIQHSTCNIYIRAQSSFLQGDRSNATEALGRGEKKVRVGFVVLLDLLAGGKSDIKRVPFKFGVFGGSLTSRDTAWIMITDIFSPLLGEHMKFKIGVTSFRLEF